VKLVTIDGNVDLGLSGRGSAAKHQRAQEDSDTDGREDRAKDPKDHQTHFVIA
jgi:hypothetical protein